MAILKFEDNISYSDLLIEELDNKLTKLLQHGKKRLEKKLYVHMKNLQSYCFKGSKKEYDFLGTIQAFSKLGISLKEFKNGINGINKSFKKLKDIDV